MNTQQLRCTEANLSSGPAHRPFNPVAQLWQSIAARWAAHLERERKAHEFDFAKEMSADALRDIGAPEPMIAQARERQDAREQHLFELRQWRDG